MVYICFWLHEIAEPNDKTRLYLSVEKILTDTTPLLQI